MRVVRSDLAAAVQERRETVPLLVQPPRPRHRQKCRGRHLCTPPKLLTLKI